MTPPQGRWRGEESGAATILVIACVGVLLSLTAVLSVGSGMVLAHRRAQAAADLVALAAAGSPDGCAVAVEVARRNDALLLSCLPQGEDVQVTVLVEGPRWLGQGHDFEARARAGP